MANGWKIDQEKLISTNKENAKEPEEVMIDITQNEKEKISEFEQYIENAIEETRILFQDGDLEECARSFRKIANSVKDLQYEIIRSGKFHPKNKLNDLTGKEWLRHTKSWIIKDGKRSDIPKEIKNHPASYPPDLAKHFIEFFTKNEMWVFDPFMGIGSTIAAAQDLNRNCIGTELNPIFAEYAQSRVKNTDLTLKVHNADCRSAADVFKENNYPVSDFLITSPPYWNMLETSRGGVESVHKKRKKEGLLQKYSENENDLGNIGDYQTFLETLVEIFKGFKPILKADAYLVIIVQNLRSPDGEVITFAWDLAKELSKHFELKQEMIWCQDQKFLGIWGYPSQYVSNVHHHYCLIFKN